MTPLHEGTIIDGPIGHPVLGFGFVGCGRLLNVSHGISSGRAVTLLGRSEGDLCTNADKYHMVFALPFGVA